jgi:transposase
VAQKLKRKGVTLTLLWQEYRTAHPDGYRYTWFCDKFAVHQRRANPTFRHSHKVEGAVLIVERWISARLRHRRFFNLADLNGAIGGLLEELNDRPMRHVGKSRRQLFEEIEREALAPLPSEPFEYAEWKTAKVHPDYHVEVDKTFYSVPHRLIGRRMDVRLTYRAVEIFQDHTRVRLRCSLTQTLPC